MQSRRNFFRTAGAAALGVAAVSRVGAASLPEAPTQASPEMQPLLMPEDGRPYNPVATLNGWSLPWRMKSGVKEFHLTAEPVKRELLPNTYMNFWGYNGGMPGPTIQVTEGDRIRILLHNNLPEPTTLHLHGLELPIAMDGIPFVTQDQIPPGGVGVYELTVHQNGTFFYHPHEAMHEAIGMVGLLIIHPRVAYAPVVDQDFALIRAARTGARLADVSGDVDEIGGGSEGRGGGDREQRNDCPDFHDLHDSPH